MLGYRDLTIHDYLDILKRRSWLILGCMAVLSGLSAGVSYRLSPLYESQTMIIIEQQQVPEDYVKPVVAESLNARLASMKEQILSRSRLEPIITRYGLFAGDGRTMDDRVEMTRKAIKVTQIHSEDSSGGMPGFFVSFDAHDPRMAQLVCGEITSLFVSANLNAQEQSAEGTTAFLRQQLDEAKKTLNEQDAKLAAFQEKYLGRLPDQESSNTNALQALTTQLDATTQSVSQMEQNESFLQTMIAQQSRDQQNSSSPIVEQADARQRELQSLIQQKIQLEAQYTPEYPDVVAISHKIVELQAQLKSSPSIPPTKKAPSVTHIDSPELQQLQAQLHSVQESLLPAKQEQARIQQQIHMYESRIEQSPMVEEQYKQITRDHDTALKFYNSLLAKMNESSMATALQLRQQGEQFSVMDPPNLPDSPKFPNHLIFAGGGLLAGLALGFAIAALLEYRDTTLRGEADVWTFTKLQTLATISHVEGLPLRPRKHRGWRRLFLKERAPAEGTGG